MTVEIATTDVDMKGPRTFEPWAVVRHDRQTFWLGESHGYDYFALTVMRIGPKDVERVVEAVYPGC